MARLQSQGRVQRRIYRRGLRPIFLFDLAFLETCIKSPIDGNYPRRKVGRGMIFSPSGPVTRWIQVSTVPVASCQMQYRAITVFLVLDLLLSPLWACQEAGGRSLIAEAVPSKKEDSNGVPSLFLLLPWYHRGSLWVVAHGGNDQDHCKRAHASSMSASSPASLQSRLCFVSRLTPATRPAQRLSAGVRKV